MRETPADQPFDALSSARQVLRLALTGSLATLDEAGRPFASLVTVATALSGKPVLLLSRLAVHTKNIERDSRASLLLVGPGGEGGDPLAGARLTLTGTVGRDDDPHIGRRFLARHPEAEGYAGFKDFGFYRFAVESSHLVAGFGRIVGIPASKLLVTVDPGFADLEADAVSHLNADHAETINLYATRLLGQPDGGWRAVGIDPLGLDMMRGNAAARLDFAEPAVDAASLRATFASLAKQARASAA
jgi:hypothetical protein